MIFTRWSDISEHTTPFSCKTWKKQPLFSWQWWAGRPSSLARVTSDLVTCEVVNIHSQKSMNKINYKIDQISTTYAEPASDSSFNPKIWIFQSKGHSLNCYFYHYSICVFHFWYIKLYFLFYTLKNKGASRCHRTGIGNFGPGGPVSCRV